MSHLDEGRLHALLDGELEDAERRETEAHLASCPSCRAALDEARALFHEADALVAQVDLPVSARPVAAPAPRGATRPPIPWQRYAFAATVVLAIGIGMLARLGSRADAPVAANALAKSTLDSLAGAAAPAESDARSAPALNRPSGKQAAERTPARNEQAREKEEASRPSELAKTAPPNTPPAAQAAGSVGAAADKAAEPARTLRQEAPSPGRADVTSAETQDAAPAAAPPAAPAAGAEARGLAPLAARRILETPAGYRRVTLEEAVRILGGSVRLVDGLAPVRVLASGQGLAQIRIVYDDPPGRELWLDQERPAAGDEGLAAPGQRPTALLPGDTVVTALPGGARSLRWVDQGGFRLGLTGYLPADSLRALARRVQ